jgi:hypothetical protein
MHSMSDTPSRSRSLWPLPGGSGEYLASLHSILEMVHASTDTDEVLDQLLSAFPAVASRKAARSYLHVVNDLGLVDLDGPAIRLTTAGQKYRETKDAKVVERALLNRIAGVPELLALIAQRPRRLGLLCEAMRHEGFSWSTQSQVRYRLRWLEEVDWVTRHGQARPEYRLKHSGSLKSVQTKG